MFLSHSTQGQNELLYGTKDSEANSRRKYLRFHVSFVIATQYNDESVCPCEV